MRGRKGGREGDREKEKEKGRVIVEAVLPLGLASKLKPHHFCHSG